MTLLADGVFRVEWDKAFVPERILEVALRGSITYLVIFFLLRFVLKRESGTIGIADLLMTVLISDAAQNAMTADYRSVTDGLFLVATIIFWNYALDWIAFHVPALRGLIRPAPLPLVVDGRIIWKNLRVELVTEDELRGQLREQGIEDLSKVKKAIMEADGRLSVIPRGEGGR